MANSKKPSRANKAVPVIGTSAFFVLVAILIMYIGIIPDHRRWDQKRADQLRQIVATESAYQATITSDTGSIMVVHAINRLHEQAWEFKMAKYVRVRIDSSTVMAQAETAFQKWVSYQRQQFRQFIEDTTFSAAALKDTCQRLDWTLKSLQYINGGWMEGRISDKDWRFEPRPKSLDSICPHDTFVKAHRIKFLQETKRACRNLTATNWPYYDEGLKTQLIKCFGESWGHGFKTWREFLDLVLPNGYPAYLRKYSD